MYFAPFQIASPSTFGVEFAALAAFGSKKEAEPIKVVETHTKPSRQKTTPDC